MFEKCNILTTESIQFNYFRVAMRRKNWEYNEDYLLVDLKSIKTEFKIVPFSEKKNNDKASTEEFKGAIVAYKSQILGNLDNKPETALADEIIDRLAYVTADIILNQCRKRFPAMVLDSDNILDIINWFNVSALEETVRRLANSTTNIKEPNHFTVGIILNIYKEWLKCNNINSIYVNTNSISDNINSKKVNRKHISANTKTKTKLHYTSSKLNNLSENKEISNSIIESANKEFAPLSLDEIVLYFKEKNITTSGGAEAFYNYYIAAGWVNGSGQPIENWKAQVKVWERREKQYNEKLASGTNSSGTGPNIKTRQYTNEELSDVFDSIDDLN
jgi:hypothetical protein